MGGRQGVSDDRSHDVASPDNWRLPHAGLLGTVLTIDQRSSSWCSRSLRHTGQLVTTHRKWLTLSAVIVAMAALSCCSASTGTLTGRAGATCSGGQAVVSVRTDRHLVARQTVVSGAWYRLALDPGTYIVTGPHHTGSVRIMSSLVTRVDFPDICV